MTYESEIANIEARYLRGDLSADEYDRINDRIHERYRPMTREFFTADNTEGYSADELRRLNILVARTLADSGINEDDPRYADAVKSACDLAHNEFER